MFEALLSNRTVSVLVEALPRILTAGLTMTIPLTLLSFFFAMIIAVAVALVQYANVPVLRQIARFYIWVIRGTPLLVQLFIIFYGGKNRLGALRELGCEQSNLGTLVSSCNGQRSVTRKTTKFIGR